MKLLVPPPLQGLICAGLIWAAATYLPQYSFEIPFKRYISALFFLSGIAIDLLALRIFYQSGTTVSPISPQKTISLIASSVYRYSRNPMYLGMACLLTGFTIWLGTPFGVLFIGLFVWSITVFQIKPEEAILLKKFGDSYADYCSKVRRWI